MRDILCQSVILLLYLAAACSANEPHPPLPVGTPVLAKRPDIQFRIKKQAVEPMLAATIFDVRQQQGEWIWLGRGWVRQSEVVRACDAVEYFSGEIQRQPTAFAQASRSTALARRRDNVRAQADAERAVELDSKYVPALVCRAARYYQASDFNRAMEDLDEAIRLTPQCADAYNCRGLTWLAKDMPDRALKDFDRAIDLSPRMASAYTDRARAWMTKGDSEHAMAEARKALKLDSRQAAAHVVLGAYWYERESYEVARLEFDEAIRFDPHLDIARYYRGKLYVRMGDYQKALVDFNLAVQLSPKGSPEAAEALDQRAYVYYRLGAMEKSGADRLAASRSRSKRHAVPPAVSPPATTTDQPARVAKDQELSGSVPSLFQRQSVLNAESWLDPADDNPSSTSPAPFSKLAQASWLNYAAWRMATSTDERYLNGPRAVELATEACELSEWKHAAELDTLAAAYAEAGDFEEAVRWQTKAIELLRDERSKKPAEERLVQYRNHQPYRDK